MIRKLTAHILETGMLRHDYTKAELASASDATEAQVNSVIISGYIESVKVKTRPQRYTLSKLGKKVFMDYCRYINERKEDQEDWKGPKYIVIYDPKWTKEEKSKNRG